MTSRIDLGQIGMRASCDADAQNVGERSRERGLY